MRPLAAACVLALAVTGGASAEEPRAGHVVRRTSPGGHEYALYLPEALRSSEPIPLLILPVIERYGWPEDRWLADRPYTDFVPHADGFAQCWVELSADRQEGPRTRVEPDVERYLLLLERDVAKIADVLSDVEAHVTLLPGGVGIWGTSGAAEQAVAVALRLPDRISYVATYFVDAGLLTTEEGRSRYGIVGWRILPPDLDPLALRLSIVFGYPESGMSRGGVRDPEALFERELAAVLRGAGLERATVRPVPPGGGPTLVLPACAAWFLEYAAEARRRHEASGRRDRLLADAGRLAEKGNLTGAVRRWRDARRLESEHGLETTSETVYPRLEIRGRALLAETSKEPPGPYRAALRKVARLFAGTPLGDEAEALLEAGR